MPLRILCYHFVDPPETDRFVRQLLWFRSKGWEFVPFSRGVGRIRDGETRRMVAITFDDGDETVVSVVQAVLDRLGIKAMLFLTTGFVGGGNRQNGRPALSWDQVRGWLAGGNEVGSHTHTHADLGRTPLPMCLEEIEISRREILRELGVQPRHIAFPWGGHQEGLDRILLESGQWESASTTDRGWNHGAEFLMKRDIIEPGWPPASTSLKMAVGANRLLYRVQRFVRGLKPLST
jgi:peptidoglycan/xylan/chitin deacetylase (PgdA/CDA1 family)